MQKSRDVDVAVLGGGPAGSTIALVLARQGYTVAIVERSRYDNLRVGEMLSPDIQPLLSSLDVWELFLLDDHLPCFGIHSAWGHASLYENDLIASPYGSGWHVDRNRFDATLVRAAEHAGAQLFRGARLVACVEAETHRWELDVQVAEQRYRLRADVVVDATGRAARLGRQQGATRMIADRLVGVVAFFSRTLAHDDDGGHYALIEAVDEGWWYSALLSDQRLVASYMTDSDLCARGATSLAVSWQQQLLKTVHTRARLESWRLDVGPTVFSANSYRLDRICGTNWLAVGDAAAAVDPLSSQGIANAVQSGLIGARAIVEDRAGKAGAFLKYEAVVKDMFNDYLIVRKKYYSREARWPQSRFWQRRQSRDDLIDARGAARAELDRAVRT